jgi:hypothetical protein
MVVFVHRSSSTMLRQSTVFSPAVVGPSRRGASTAPFPFPRLSLLRHVRPRPVAAAARLPPLLVSTSRLLPVKLLRTWLLLKVTAPRRQSRPSSTAPPPGLLCAKAVSCSNPVGHRAVRATGQRLTVLQFRQRNCAATARPSQRTAGPLVLVIALSAARPTHHRPWVTLPWVRKISQI